MDNRFEGNLIKSKDLMKTIQEIRKEGKKYYINENMNKHVNKISIELKRVLSVQSSFITNRQNHY